MLRFGLAVAVAVLGMGLLGCNSVDDDSDPSAGGGAGVAASSGQAASAGTSSTTAGGSSQAGPSGAAGSGDAASGLEWGEPVAKLCDDLWFVTIIDDGHVFEGCFESQEVDYNLVEQFTLRQLTDGTATLIASSKTPIRMLTMDRKGYFVQQFQDFDKSKNSFGGDIRRLAFGTTELVPFYDLGGNDRPSIVLQTDAACVISQPSEDGYLNAVKYFASVVIADKTTAQKRTVFLTAEGSFITSWLDGNNVGFVIKLPEGPFEYHVPLATGVATKGAALPNLCSNFLHRADGFLAVCGSEGDLVQIDSNGKQTKLTTGVQSWDKLYDFDRIYWSSLDSIGVQVQGLTLHAVDAAGRVSELKLSGDVFVEGMTPKFAYASVRDETGTWLRRVPLADVK